MKVFEPVALGTIEARTKSFFFWSEWDIFMWTIPVP